MRFLLTLIFILTLIVAAPAGDTWSWNDDRKLKGATIIAWEVELSQSFVGPWELFATVYEPVVSLDGLPDGIYFIRIRAIGPGGLASQTTFPIRFTIPRPAPIPPATHARLTILRTTDGITWTPIAEYLDPIDSRALYKLDFNLATIAK